MSQTLISPAGAATGRSLPKPPSIFRTGARLPEVRWATVALALFLVGGAAQLAGAPAVVWWFFYLACYAAGGWEPALSGLRALREKTLDVDLLMIVAAIAAAAIGQVFDGALLIVIFATSGALEALVTQRTADSVSSLLGLAPERATRLLDGTGPEEEVNTADLQVGDVILVRPGERIGADGTVIRGVSEVDQAAMTGESVPVIRREGDEVLSGTVNGSGALSVRVAKAAKDSVVSRIVTLVEEASATKAKTQLFIEKVEQRYSVGVIVATLLVFFLPLSLGESLDAALLRAITFMIVASPCAVVLSTMPPLLAAIANAGRHGVLVKSATVMEQVGRTNVVAFDKTGTLTDGTPKVTSVDSLDAALNPAQILGLAAAVEQYSEHPLGRAILRDAREKSLTVEPAAEFKAVPGQGVSGIVHGRLVRVERPSAEDDDTVAGTVVYVIIDGATAGRITLADRLRPTAAATVERLRQITGNPVHLLTGDNHRAAAQIAAETGIDDVRSRLLPADKAAAVHSLEQDGHRVLLIGDGVNDAPAIAAATTGIAMGRHGSDLALDTADAIIVRDELEALPSLIAISKRAHRFVIANLAIAATFITVLVTWDLISTLPLPLAVAGHEGSTVIVALNGLRLLRSQAWKN
ncbi:heavy metal translocating P-type ATPase [Arthrobacter sp. TB 26]|uniref:heavy metal translocating P-type ATPase n=1 Tax=Arthrobacter sp. TB 26 TaxID=494420 RepID=UPI00040568B9|nr:heavy metal translocating P-type ATPase [Arthrobacter sp. TB 26]